MKLIEQIQLKPSAKLYHLCHLCKSLYNLGNYYINMNYEIMEKYLNWYDTKWMLKASEPFKRLPAQVAQNVLKYLHLSWKSYFSAIKDWKKNPKKYKRRPNPPRYLRKDGEYIACFNHQHIPQKKQLSKEKMKRYLHFPKKADLDPIEIETCYSDLQQVRIIPKNDIYNLEIVYNHIKTQDLKLDNDRMIAIDLGVNNLACIVNNIGLKPFVINGKPLKSTNHFYNKGISRLQTEMSKRMFNECKQTFIGKIYKKDGKLTKKFISYLERNAKRKLQQTRKMKKLRRIRNNKIKDYIHKASRYIINYCIENNIGTIIIGRNNNWKQKINIGKKNNQNFVQIPFNVLIKKIQYKTELIGINIEIITEEYTSLCSFLDNEKIGKHKKYAGKRIKRGLFKASDDRLINADVNGAYNILRKAFPNTFMVDGIQGAQLHPIRINLDTKSKLTCVKIS